MQIQYSDFDGSDIVSKDITTTNNNDHVPYTAMAEDDNTRDPNIIRRFYNRWCCCSPSSSLLSRYSNEGNTTTADNSNNNNNTTNDNKNSYTTNYLLPTDRTNMFEWIQDYQHVVDILLLAVVFILQNIIATHPTWIFGSLWHVRLFAALLFGLPVYMCMVTSQRTTLRVIVAASVAIFENIIFIPLYCLQQLRINYTTTPSLTDMSQVIDATSIVVYIWLWFICVTFPTMLWHTIRNKSSLRRNITPSFISGNSAIYYDPPSVV